MPCSLFTALGCLAASAGLAGSSFFSGGRLQQQLLLLALLLAALELALNTAHRLLGRKAAVADGGIQILQRGIGYLLQQHRQKLRVQHILHGDAAVPQLRVKGRAAVDDVFVLRSFLNH